MAFTTSTAFIGTNRAQILERLVLGAESLDKGLIQMITGKFDDTYLGRMTMADDPLTAPVDTPTVSKTVAKDEVSITPGRAEVYVEFNPNTFQNDWEDYWPDGAEADNQLPQELLTPLLSVIGKKVNKQVEKMIWQGDTAGAAAVNRWDGYEKLIDADASVVDVAAPLALTSANIIGEMDRIIDAIDDAVYNDPGLRMVMSHTNARMYDAAAAALATKGVNIDERMRKQYRGIPIVSVSGISQGRIVTGVYGADVNSNFFGQTWMEADRSNFKVARLQANSQLWFVKALFQMGVNYGFGEEIVNYAGS